MDERTYAFPRALRLTKTDEFSSVFVLRSLKRSAHFVLYGRRNALDRPRLGVVIGKRFARRATERNRLKRQIREAFRTQQAELKGLDIILRLHAAFGRDRFKSGQSVQRAARAEADRLLEFAAKTLLERADV
jgi:ribonuclease P protein component